MSTGPRIPLAQAAEEAQEFRAIFADCAERWEIAGSVRRGRPDVGDVEHVVIPRLLTLKPDKDLWGKPLDPVTVNAVWERLEMHVERGALSRWVYTDGSHRWGPKYRGVSFRERRHEVFLADPSNFGAILTIRTGPAEFSERLVTLMKQRGIYRQDTGYVRYASGPAEGEAIECPTEERYLEMCGVAWIEPEARDAWMEKQR